MICLEEKFGGHTDKAIAYVQEQMDILYRKNKNKPRKPEAPKLKTSFTIREYADQLEKYEIEFTEWSKNNDEYTKTSQEYYSVLRAYLESEAGVNQYVPEKYRAKVCQKAWEIAHSSGYNEYFNVLMGLVDIFNVKEN